MFDRHRRELADDGFTVFEDYADAESVERLRTAIEERFAIEGETAGSEFRQEPGSRRLANLVNKGEVFRESVVDPLALEAVESVIAGPFKLSSLNVRSSDPGNAAQPLHADGGAIADDQGYWVANVVWVIDEFREDNGPLRVVPGTHRLRKLPQEVLDDPLAPHPDEVVVTAQSGSLIVLNAHTWHGGLLNASSESRLALHAFYCRRDKPQQQFQRSLLSDEVLGSLSPKLREVLAIDDPDDGNGFTDSGGSGFLD
ncbi:MAG: phytanoyl-CoA dioxygenase family protein [Planctomycetota bacterium]